MTRPSTRTRTAASTPLGLLGVDAQRNLRLAAGTLRPPTTSVSLGGSQACSRRSTNSAQGRPWLFREIDHFLTHQQLHEPPSTAEIRDLLLTHLNDLYAFYGEYSGVRVARKHIGWYVRTLDGGEGFRQQMNALESAQQQLSAVQAFFDCQTSEHGISTNLFGQAA